MSPEPEHGTTLAPPQQPGSRPATAPPSATAPHPRAPAQWREPPRQPFTRADREHTTILLGGLTLAHDRLLAAALRHLGYRTDIIPTPDNTALELGKAFCDRAMCNPAYYTVGALLRHLERLQQERGLSPDELKQRYVALTANGCGPCRYGLYIGEYRKALREIGLGGFRVMLFNQKEALEDPADNGFEVNNKLLLYAVGALLLADVLNAVVYRTRPYELEPGATDRAMAAALPTLERALAQGEKPHRALRDLRRALAAIPLDHTRIKPKVSIIGEIWAQTTEGEGNYRLPAFLEAEGAEVDVQPLAAWILLMRWENRYDAGGRQGLAPGGVPRVPASPGAWKGLLHERIVEWLVRRTFRRYARLVGLDGYTLPDCDRLAAATHRYFDVNQRGGEMFMEVAKALNIFQHRKSHMIVSIKPFGCMPSSGVSDGVQALVAEHFPDAIFLPIETTGDGSANVYSRLQMQLFKARQAARDEVALAARETGLHPADVRKELLRRRAPAAALYAPVHRFTCTAANAVLVAARRRAGLLGRLRRRRPSGEGT